MERSATDRAAASTPPQKNGPPDAAWGDDPASHYCEILLKDAGRLLRTGPQAWNEREACLDYDGFDHFLLAPEPDASEAALQSACYLLRLPMEPREDAWAVFMLEINLILMAHTGMALALDLDRGLMLTRRLTGDELDPLTLVHVMRQAIDVVHTFIRQHLDADARG